MLLSPRFFTNPFSLNVHLGFFKGLHYFSLYCLYLLEYTYQRDIPAGTNAQVLILMMTAVLISLLALWVSISAGKGVCLAAQIVWRGAASQTTSRVFIFTQAQLSAVT